MMLAQRNNINYCDLSNYMKLTFEEFDKVYKAKMPDNQKY